MLWNNFHKLLLFHQIQFQVFVLTAGPNLKINVIATFQIVCNLQRKTRAIMNYHNSKKGQDNGRCSRSISSPPGQHNQRLMEPQRTQSLYVIGSEQQNSYPMQNFVSYPQLRWNYNMPVYQNPGLIFINPNMCPSTSNVSTQNFATIRGLSNQNYSVLERQWEPDKPIEDTKKQFIFSVMSYNVLAQDLVEGHMYLYNEHDKRALDWKVRWVNILNEIGNADPDMICFQEVQESHIADYFSVLGNLGYEGIYKKRTGIRTDGCAIYYKTKRFQLLDYAKIEYFQANVAILNRDNVGIIARFMPKEVNKQPFVIATTHLLYNPNRQDVRLAQMQYLMTEIDKIAFAGMDNQGKSSYLPIILTGDLNATPDSAIYEFIVKGKLRYEDLSKSSLVRNGGKPTGKILIPESLKMTDNCQYAEIVKTRNACGENAKNCIKFSSGTLSHPFLFKSAYSHFINSDTEGTTYQDRWITVDYIFYSGKRHKNATTEDKLKIISKYRLLTKKQLNDIKIPNWKLGSDHFSLMVKFALK